MDLQQSGSAASLRAAVEQEVGELEGLCGRFERCLMRRTWDDMDAAMADARRVTHALQNAMEAAVPVRDAEFDERIYRRLRMVYALRSQQMERLEQYHSAVGERLHLISRWKNALRSMSAERAASRLGSLDRLS